MSKFLSLISKKNALFFIYILILNLSKIFAEEEYSCFEVDEEPTFAFKAEYIYWRPVFDNNFVATPVIDEYNPFTLKPGGPENKNKFDYSSGYRLGAIYFIQNPCSLLKDGSFRYTYLPAQHSRKTSLLSFLFDLIENPEEENDTTSLSQPEGLISADHSLDYYGSDLFLTISVLKMPGFELLARPGLHYSDMRYNSKISFSILGEDDFRAIIQEWSHSYGIGPQLNLVATYQLLDGLMIKGSFTEGVLFSHADAHFKVNRFGTIVDEINSDLENPCSLWKFFVFWEASLSLCFDFNLYDYSIGIEVGYDYLSYPNFINRIQLMDTEDGLQAESSFSTFNFLGPYASILITF